MAHLTNYQIYQSLKMILFSVLFGSFRAGDGSTSGEDSCVAAAVACADAAAAPDVSDDSEQSMTQNPRAANRTHTAWQN